MRPCVYDTMILFNGKLTIESLGLRDRRLLNNTDLVRVDDPSGEVARILTQTAAHYIAYVEFAPKDAPVVRGNHYHLRREEYFYMASGTLDAYFMDLETGERYQQKLTRGDLVHCRPGCVHAFVAQEFVQIIEYAPTPLDLTDKVMHQII